MFKKYNSIENTYRKEFIDRIHTHGYGNDTFIVQEKVHGSNLSFFTQDGTQFTAGKRTSSLAADEKFYNHQLLLEQNYAAFQMLWKALGEIYNDLSQMTIFGEVIGGSYAHKAIKAVPGAIKVQKGIFYSPANHFFAFDILVNGEHYVDVEDANSLFEQANLFYAKTLFKGGLEDCMAHSNEFDSTLPAELGLPPISPNICEGVIIRPIKNVYFNNGVRVILKNKNEKWSENLRFSKTIKKAAPLPEKVVLLQEALATYATRNRLNNVLSKFGETTDKDFGKVLGLFNKDIIEDFMKDYRERMEELEKKDRKLVTKSLSKVSAQIVRDKVVKQLF